MRIPRPRTPWSGQAPSRGTIVAGVLTICLLGGCSTAAYAYDRANARTFLDETRIGGVDVGGLRAAEAASVLEDEIEAPLRLPLHVAGDGFDVETSAWDLGLRVDVDDAVRDELAQQRDAGILRRLWQRVAGGGAGEVSLVPRLDRAALTRFAEEAARSVHIETKDAVLEVTGDGWLRMTPARIGREMDPDEAADVLERAVRTGADEVDLPVRSVPPKVPTQAYERVLLVRTGENSLHLYEHGRISRSYRVASGKPGYRTPTGTFEIVRKRKNPTWINPGGDWARTLPARIGPGPDNPLGTRAMDLNVGAIRIHGTSDASSIGRDASHGCVRMHLAEAEDLFRRVSVGTPVVIVDTRTP